MKLKEARLCKKNNFSGSKKSFFPHFSYETQRSPALEKKTTFQALKNCFFPHCSYETQRSSALQKKKSVSKNMFFPHCSHETQTSPALQKTIFQALRKSFFRMPLAKSANSTSLPRLSSGKIVET